MELGRMDGGSLGRARQEEVLDGGGGVKAAFIETVRMVERLHRQCLEVIKAEIDQKGIRDLNNVQALILFNIGDGEVSIGELTQRGYYLGSNVSYNVKKLVKNGYLVQERSPHDRRSTHVRASEKGLATSTISSSIRQGRSARSGSGSPSCSRSAACLPSCCVTGRHRANIGPYDEAQAVAGDAHIGSLVPCLDLALQLRRMRLEGPPPSA